MLTGNWYEYSASCYMDSLAPISALLENAERMTVEDIKEASSAAAKLIGNANA